VIINRLVLKNWRNFPHVNVKLRERGFVVGANASGKSNLLDAFRFLRDVAKPDGGGLQKALKDRGGISKVRSLAARRDPEITIEVWLSNSADEPALWGYALGIKQEARGLRQPYVSFERVWHRDKQVVNRPDKQDESDHARLTQTFLEQIGSNASFREIVSFFQRTTYLHLVPQLLRFADNIQGRIVDDDPFGQGFLERVAKTSEKTQKARLSVIERALKMAVPQLQQLQFIREPATGRPHLQALYSHWRPNAGWQREDQFSDGTLRLIGLLWVLLEGDSLLLLEEPELSLNSGVVSQIAPLIFRLQKPKKRQVLITTHSEALLTERGIDGREVLLLQPGAEGTQVTVASELEEVTALLKNGFTVGEVVLPKTKPAEIGQLSLIE
jgi:predicted ATPase